MVLSLKGSHSKIFLQDWKAEKKKNQEQAEKWRMVDGGRKVGKETHPTCGDDGVLEDITAQLAA